MTSIYRSNLNTRKKIFNSWGRGLKRYFFIRVFKAGFYSESGVAPQDVLQDVPKRIELIYYTKLPGKRLAWETRKAMRRNTTEAEYEQIKSRIDIMDGLWVDLNPGDHFVNVYIPGYGTDYIFNGKLIGHIEGDDFARALFAVWVGEYPIDPGLRSKLLGYDK